MTRTRLTLVIFAVWGATAGMGCARGADGSPGSSGSTDGGSGAGGASIGSGDSGSEAPTDGACQTLMVTTLKGAVDHANLLHFDGGRLEWLMRASAAGADGEWGTPDDDFDYLDVHAYDDAGRLTEVLQYSAPGVDGMWRSPDDSPAQRRELQYPSPARMLAVEWAVGADGAFASADDAVLRWRDHELSPSAAGGPKPLRDVTHEQPGPDGTFLTSDDPIARAKYYEHDPDGTRREYFVSAPGPDGTWFTPDDSVDLMAELACDPAAGAASYHWFGPGPDGVFGTADDVDDGQSTFTFEACGILACSALGVPH